MEKLNLPDKGIVLVVTKSEDYTKANADIIYSIIKSKNRYCVYLSLNKPSFTLLENFAEAGLDTKKIFIIDCVTSLAGEDVERAGNVVFVESPSNLTEIGTVLDGAIKSIPIKGSFLFLDSLSTMLLYNAAKTVATFVHFLSLKIRYYKMAGVIISLQNQESSQIISQISEFCDMRITI